MRCGRSIHVKERKGSENKKRRELLFRKKEPADNKRFG